MAHSFAAGLAVQETGDFGFALWKDKTGQLFRKEAEGVAVNSARRDTALSVVATRCEPASVPCDPDVRRVTLGFAAACAIVTRRTPISRGRDSEPEHSR